MSKYITSAQSKDEASLLNTIEEDVGKWISHLYAPFHYDHSSFGVACSCHQILAKGSKKRHRCIVWINQQGKICWNPSARCNFNSAEVRSYNINCTYDLGLTYQYLRR